MNESNFWEVGQIRSRSGISTKMIRRPETLRLSVDVEEEVRVTYMQKMVKIIRGMLNEKMLAMPTARHRTMHSTPVLGKWLVIGEIRTAGGCGTMTTRAKICPLPFSSITVKHVVEVIAMISRGLLGRKYEAGRRGWKLTIDRRYL